MNRIKRPAAAIGAAALLAFSLAACGGDSGGSSGGDSPANASKDDFCSALKDAYQPLAGIEDEPTEDQWRSFQDSIDKLSGVGTPDDISDDARVGFDAFVKAVGDTDYEEAKDYAGDTFPGVDKGDEDKVVEFLTYSETTCPDVFGVPSDIPTELSDLPSDLPTDLSDIPTDLSDIPSDLLSDLSDLTAPPTS